jgi:pyruvate formate lyase activating enzyme
VEVTTLIIPGWNDDEKEIKAEAQWLSSVDPLMPWHVTAFHPDYLMRDTPQTPPESLVRTREIGMHAGLKYIYCGNIPFAYSDYEATSCHGCGKRIISRFGFKMGENDIRDGKCRFCKTRIPGIWK